MVTPEPDLLRLAAEALRGVLPMSSDGTGHIDCEYDEERNLNCGCIDVLPRAAAAVLEAVLPGVRARAAAVWDEAINHVWELSDPVSTIDHAEDPPVSTVADMRQAMRENPYRARADEEREAGR